MMIKGWHIEYNITTTHPLPIPSEEVDREALAFLPENACITYYGNRSRIDFIMVLEETDSVNALADANNWVRETWQFKLGFRMDWMDEVKVEIVEYERWLAEHVPVDVQVWASGEEKGGKRGA